MDPRTEAYARLLVDCIAPEPGWQVLVRSQPLARPLIEEVSRELARRGVRALVRLTFDSVGGVFVREAPLELLGELSSIEINEIENADSYMAIVAPENTRDGSDIPAERTGPRQQAMRRHHGAYLSDEKPWVGCYYPTAAAAQDAGMSVRAFEDFLYGAVLVDWEALRRTMEGSPSASTGRARCGSSARAPTSPSASRDARGRSTRSAPTCRAARSSTRPSRTRPKASSAIRSIRPATSATRSAASASASRAAGSSMPPRRATRPS